MELSNISSNSQFEKKKGSLQSQKSAKNIKLGIAVVGAPYTLNREIIDTQILSDLY